MCGKNKLMKKYHHLRNPLLEIARAHPEYGYRRITAELIDKGFHVNRKVVERLHSFWGLYVIKTIKRPGESVVRVLMREASFRINFVAQLKDISDFDVIYADFTEICYQKGMVKAQLMPIIDYRSKLVVGHALGKSSNTKLALEALRRVKKTLRRFGQNVEHVNIHYDQDGVYIGQGWVYEVFIKDKVRVSILMMELKEMSIWSPLLGGFKKRSV